MKYCLAYSYYSGARQITMKIPLIIVSMEKLVIKKTKWTSKIRLSMKEYNEIISYCATLNEVVKVSCNKEIFKLFSQCQDTTVSINFKYTNLQQNDVCDILCMDTHIQTFSIANLAVLCDVSNTTRYIQIELAQNEPLCITYYVDNVYEMKLYIAPLLEDKCM